MCSSITEVSDHALSRALGRKVVVVCFNSVLPQRTQSYSLSPFAVCKHLRCRLRCLRHEQQMKCRTDATRAPAYSTRTALCDTYFTRHTPRMREAENRFVLSIPFPCTGAQGASEARASAVVGRDDNHRGKVSSLATLWFPTLGDAWIIDFNPVRL